MAALYDLLSDDLPPWTCRIDTQRWLRSAGGERRCADLELTFERPGLGGHRLHLRVEVKHGSKPHSGQLQAYIDEQQSSRNAAVLLLAPRQDYPFEPGQVPEEVAQLRWQDTARVIGEWRPDDPVGRFLISELTAFLHEEDLVDPEDLKHDHLVALEVHQEALNALERVCELAATRVDSQWNKGDGPGSTDALLSRSAGGHTRRTPGSRRPRASTSVMPGNLHGRCTSTGATSSRTAQRAHASTSG